MSGHAASKFDWICTGDEIFPAMLDAIHAARKSIRFEMYIYADDDLGKKFLQALVDACQRGVQVRVLIDALGSLTLFDSFWDPLRAVGGEMRWFNPIEFKRFEFRDHRKLLACDEQVAFVGGFNITMQYAGDGVKSGWRDLGMRLSSPLVPELCVAFDDMFQRADFQHKLFSRLRKTSARRRIGSREGELLLTGPGRGWNPFNKALRRDLRRAKEVQIIVAYFLPTRRIRAALMRAARRGARVQLILAGKSDVRLSQLAGQSLYRRLLRAGVEIYEYQPQILHAKLFIVNQFAYAGSSNLDQRSLAINYELMLRFKSPELAQRARDCFQSHLAHCKRINLEEWRKSRSWLDRLKQRWAYFILVRVDRYVAKWQYRRLPN